MTASWFFLSTLSFCKLVLCSDGIIKFDLFLPKAYIIFMQFLKQIFWLGFWNGGTTCAYINRTSCQAPSAITEEKEVETARAMPASGDGSLYITVRIVPIMGITVIPH